MHSTLTHRPYAPSPTPTPYPPSSAPLPHLPQKLTPLHFAADRGHSDICEFLLQNGAKVDAVENTGQTALMYAVACEYKVRHTALCSASLHRLSPSRIAYFPSAPLSFYPSTPLTLYPSTIEPHALYSPRL
jgi:hypothetical protein